MRRRRKRKEKRINLSIEYISVFISHCFSSVLTNKYQRTATVKHKENADQCAEALKDMSYELHVIAHY
jgi:hypothetical protein